MKIVFKRLLICGIITLHCLIGLGVYASEKENFAEADKLLMAASASVAAYNDRVGNLACEYLEQSGWEVQPYVQANSKVDARFLVARKMTSGKPIYLFAITGTETLKDIKTDLRFDKVYFAGNTPEKLDENAKKENIPNKLPKVHRGFFQYVRAGLMVKAVKEDGQRADEYLSERLFDTESQIYIVGHSMGGAVATLGGAALINMGVKPEQIEVISFGAPAVGNKAFAEEYRPMLNLKRVVINGDPVTGVLQKIAGGYEQFGEEIRWETSDSAGKGPHTMVEYLDLAIKNYYDKRHQMNGELSDPYKLGDGSKLVYVSAAANKLPEALAGESWHMQQVLWDEYKRTLPQYVLDIQPHRIEDKRKIAAEKGCKWFVASELSGYKLKDKPNEYHVTLTQTVYDTTNGNLVYMASHSTGTNNLTPLEALIHDARSMEPDMAKWLLSKDGASSNGEDDNGQI